MLLTYTLKHHQAPPALGFQALGLNRVRRTRRRPNPNGVASFSPGLARIAGLPWVGFQKSGSTPTGLHQSLACRWLQPLRGCSNFDAISQGSPALRVNPGLKAITPLG